MHELDGQIALVTETWMKKSPFIDNQMQNLSCLLGYECIRKDRETGQGGGVAIVYKKGDLQLQQIKTGSRREVVAAIGRRTGQRRKIVVMVAYIPPSLNADESDAALNEISELIGVYKRRYNSPYFLIGGDFNKRRIGSELRRYSDIQLVQTPPTRDNNTLDLVFTNFSEYVTESGVTEAICSQTGTGTDHLTVFVNAQIPRVPQYQVEEYTYLKQTDEGDSKLAEFLKGQDWDELMQGKSSNEMVNELHRVFDEGMEASYKRMKSSKKSSEPPWMTNGIRRLIKRCRAVFRKLGRNQVWKKLKKQNQEDHQAEEENVR